MDATHVLIAVFIFYCVIFFFDTIFKSCAHYPYVYFLKNTGIQTQAFRLSWFTTAFNRCLLKYSMLRARFIDAWFNAGAWVSLIVLPVASGLVLQSTIQLLLPGGSGSGGRGKQTVVLEPLVPGVNLPLGDIGYFTATLAICSIVHEAGHALAAAREDVHIFGVGISVIFLLPFAYVHLSSENLHALLPMRQLRIMCAGIWHNIVLAALAVVLGLLLPWLLCPLYTTGRGVYVQAIQPDSPVLGPTGLRVGDQVLGLAACPVTDGDSWQRCIVAAIRQQSPGYCISAELVEKHDQSVPAYLSTDGSMQCCDAEHLDNLCFEYEEKADGFAGMPPHSCLPGRSVVESSTVPCRSGDDCSEGLHCIKPLLGNTTKLVVVRRRHDKPVLFIGHPAEIFHTVSVSSFVPAYSALSSSLPEAVLRLLNYVAMISAGLAVVNVIPCFYLDGQHIALALTNLLLARRLKRRSARQAIAYCVTIFGSVMLTVNIALVIVRKVF